MSEFSDILSKPMDDVKRPERLPVGTYLFQIGSKYELRKVGEKKTPVVTFAYAPLQAMDDVDQEQLQAAQQSWGDKTLKDKSINVDFWLSDDAQWRLTEHAKEALGIPGGLSLQELLEEMKGKTVIGTVTEQPGQGKNAGEIYTRVGAFARAE